jgi:hypothetical protein
MNVLIYSASNFYAILYLFNKDTKTKKQNFVKMTKAG